MSNKQLTFSSDELIRYSQQLKLQDIGVQGQQKLKAARVLCVGVGGLGSSLLLYLAGAGVGTIGIIDDDAIELSNLQRQILYQSSQVGRDKVTMAKGQLNALNPHIDVQTYSQRLDLDLAKKLIPQYDIIADCSDNFVTRYLINDICFENNKPYAFASIAQFEGQCALFLGGEEACYRCLFPKSPEENTIPNCNETGVLGVLPGLLGIIQATEILKWILQIGELLANRILTINILKMHFQEFKLQKNPDCTGHIKKKSIHVADKRENLSVETITISALELKKLLQNTTDILLLDVRSAQEHEVDNIGGVLIPLPELTYRLNELDRQKPIIVYCQSGPRSMQAMKILVDNHFMSVKYLVGGMSEWRKQ